MSNVMIERLKAEGEDLALQVRAISEAAKEAERDLDDTELETIGKLNARAEAIENQIRVLRQAEERIAKVVESASEVKTAAVNVRTAAYADNGVSPIYGTGSEYNFIADLLRAELDRDMEASRRLGEHQVRTRKELELRASAVADLPGTFIPQYEKPLDVVLEGRPFANSLIRREVRSHDWHIPVVDAPLTTAAQATENSSFSDSDYDTTDATYSVTWITGMTELSVKALDFSTVSEQDIIGALIRSYNQKLDYYLLNGTGASGQVEGVLVTSGTNEVDAQAASDFGDVFAAVVEAAAEVNQNTLAPATHMVLTPYLWGWLKSRTDSDGRPLMGFSNSAPQNVGGVWSGEFAGLTVVVDSNLVTYGATPSADKILVYRASDVWFAEANGGVPTTIRVDQAKASQGTVQFVARNYVNFPGVQPRPEVATVVKLPYLSY